MFIQFLLFPYLNSKCWKASSLMEFSFDRKIRVKYKIIFKKMFSLLSYLFNSIACDEQIGVGE